MVHYLPTSFFGNLIREQAIPRGPKGEKYLAHVIGERQRHRFQEIFELRQYLALDAGRQSRFDAGGALYCTQTAGWIAGLPCRGSG